jgi:hypothetical protein
LAKQQICVISRAHPVDEQAFRLKLALFRFAFPQPQSKPVLISPFTIDICIHFIAEEIGFVFSESYSDLARLSPLCDLEIESVWLCSSAVPKRRSSHNRLLEQTLHSCGHPANWVCFFKMVFRLGLPFSAHSGLIG